MVRFSEQFINVENKIEELPNDLGRNASQNGLEMMRERARQMERQETNNLRFQWLFYTKPTGRSRKILIGCRIAGVCKGVFSLE